MRSPCCRSSSSLHPTLLFACKVSSHNPPKLLHVWDFYQLFHPVLGSISPEIIYFRAMEYTALIKP
ncbi:hypothetical protein BDV26DRAFT_272832 [Aspergillus bertholletiae]|uniref:Uncharacterized protein n=1 Tax=Aspergillus bertholletiae TaxID=1226010 RepID=A0A5N7AT97_9EURO|nr:hypothetical protein BDV26DRAFT_272832 [Aspergillus bertholletiae]